MREKDAAKEVARLELQLAQQNVAVLQSQFDEGRVNLREVERARVAENDKWMIIWMRIFRGSRRRWICCGRRGSWTKFGSRDRHWQGSGLVGKEA